MIRAVEYSPLIHVGLQRLLDISWLGGISEVAMRLRRSYTLSFLSRLPEGFQIPLRLELEGIVFEIIELDENTNRASAFIDGPVNPDTLQVRIGQPPLDGSQPQKGIEVVERTKIGSTVSDFINIIAFLTDVPIRYSSNLGKDRLVAESKIETDFLESLETQRIYVTLEARVSTRSFSLPRITDDELQSLSTKRAGLALYSQALLMQESVAVFREFWKILESAFGAKDKKLIQHLANYEIAKQLKYTEEELERLRTLRGRASHAESRRGIEEHRYVTAETQRVLPRLKCLVEQLLLTKKNWGAPDTETKPLAPIASFVDPNGGLILIRREISSANE